MMKRFRFLPVLLALVVAVGIVSGCGIRKGSSKSGKIVIGKVPITLNSAVHQSDDKWEAQYLKEKYGADFIDIDGKADATVTDTAVEDLIAKKVSGIIINPAVPASINEKVKEAKAAGIPVITYYMTPTEEKIPYIRVNEASTSKIMGEEAAKKWKELYPNKPIKIGIIEFLTNPQIMAMRSIPFIAGVKEVDPSAVVVSELDGNGDTQKSLAAAQDMLQSHPEVNIIYGTSSNSSLPILSAFQAAGRGKAVDGKPLTEIICGTDATEAELLQLINPTSSLKFTQGMTPHENAIVEDDTMMKVIQGKLSDDKQTIIDVHDKSFDYYIDSVKSITDWLNSEYFMNVDLQAELDRTLGKK